MFLSSDLMNKRKTKSIDNRDDMKFTPIQT